MQCPHCYAELRGNPITCPQCRQKIRSLSTFNPTRPVAPFAPNPMQGMPPPADASPQHLPPPADATPQYYLPPQTARPPMPRVVPRGPVPPPYYAQAPSTKKIGIILGYIGLAAWLLPIIGIPLSIVGLVFAAKEKHTAALVINICVLVASVINSIVGILIAIS